MAALNKGDKDFDSFPKRAENTIEDDAIILSA
jgi:hypothetical protein